MTRRMRTCRMNTLRALGLAATALVLAGCASDDGVAGSVGDAGYVSGDGFVTEIAAGDRGEAMEFGGETVDGDAWTTSENAGVTVVNFWYAACPPCRVEAPVLVDLHEEYGGDVSFVGVNVRDGAAQAESFDETFGIEYPSILDAQDAAVQRAFSGQIAPNAVPTTIILDAEGRIAARISGAVSDTSIISTLLDEELARQ
ncbi:Thiol:disulfide oxidoreductase related to ResA [Agrococcus casei LMG 22410]|uniref:Thiol:disulfide oxidoreductase related to ResA n=2 Tax=Agrococcus TaxID=46352 RepID=A0A1R4GA12_9MICO|nr:Thiol:disulfide oxidoreductase related to ResA [Agrococcus casei LMG 22410]